jgi:hypothetical protein
LLTIYNLDDSRQVRDIITVGLRTAAQILNPESDPLLSGLLQN